MSHFILFGYSIFNFSNQPFVFYLDIPFLIFQKVLGRLVWSQGLTPEAHRQVLPPWVSRHSWRLHWNCPRWSTIYTLPLTEWSHNKGSNVFLEQFCLLLTCFLQIMCAFTGWQIHWEGWCRTGEGRCAKAEHSTWAQSVRNWPFLPLPPLHVSAGRCAGPIGSPAQMQPALGLCCKGLFPDS